MAGAAVAQALHQVGAAQQLLVAACGRGVRRRRRGKHPAPDAQRKTHRQRPRNIRGAVRRCIRRHAMHQIGVQCAHVGVAQARIGRVGHGRVHRVALFRHAGAHQLVEIFKTPVADAVLLVRRDIGGVHLADRRGHAEAASIWFALRGCVAGDAVAGARQVFALPDLLRVGGGGHAGASRQQQGQRREEALCVFFHGAVLTRRPVAAGLSDIVRARPWRTSRSARRPGRSGCSRCRPGTRSIPPRTRSTHPSFAGSG